MNVLEKIKKLLDENKVEYKTKHHEPTRTSEESAKARGDNIKQGAKAIIINADDEFVLAVLSAERKIDSKKLRKILEAKKTSFADSDFLKSLNLEQGNVPPFGSVIGLKTYADKSLLENKEISFNAGSLTDSISMRLEDYLAVEKPTVAEFS